MTGTYEYLVSRSINPPQRSSHQYLDHSNAIRIALTEAVSFHGAEEVAWACRRTLSTINCLLIDTRGMKSDTERYQWVAGTEAGKLSPARLVQVHGRSEGEWSQLHSQTERCGRFQMTLRLKSYFKFEWEGAASELDPGEGA